MHPMHSWYTHYAVKELSNFDWNLLKSLDALLIEGNVTRAAERAGVSQPAMSRALGRLRDVFADELFSRSAGGMEPTERARELGAVLKVIKLEVERAVVAPHFDPATAERTFVVTGADLVEFLFVPRLMKLWQREAPGVDLRFLRSSDGPLELLQDREIDVVLNPRVSESNATARSQKLFDERFVCIARRGHPQVNKRLTLAAFAEMNHLLIAPRGRPGGVVDGQLAKHGRRRRVAALVPTFLAAPQIVAETDMVATLPRGLAQTFAQWLPIVLFEPPLDVPGFTLMQYWNAAKSADPAHDYLRKSLLRVAKEIVGARRR